MIYVAPSIYRSIDPRTMAGLLAVLSGNATGERVWLEPLWGDALIARSRSLLASKFMEDEALADADVMVIVDDDILFEPEDFWKIVEGARDTRSIYGGMYVTRSKQAHLASRVLPNRGEIDIHRTPERRPVEIQYLATGFMAIHRDVFRALLCGEFEDAFGKHTIPRCTQGADRPWWPFFLPFVKREDPTTVHPLSEDWAFCERARQLGFKVWADQSIILGHVGQAVFTVADLHVNGAAATNQAPPSVGTTRLSAQHSRPYADEPLLATLVDDIAEFTEEDPGDVRRALPTGAARLAQLWKERGEQSERDWYESEQVGLAYMLDLAKWHLDGYGVPLGMASMLAGKHVYDFGAGIGTFALAAARAGAHVTVHEVNPELNAFIDWRARRHALPVELRDPALMYEPEAVVAWHVFEHLEDPEHALSAIAAMLERHRGILITDSDFEADDDHPMHHTHPDWEGALAAAGFANRGNGVYEFVGVPAEAVA